MISTTLSTIALFSVINLSALVGTSSLTELQKPEVVKISEQKISLNKRIEGSETLNQVYKDNILLNMAYMRGIVSDKANINWDEVRKNFDFEFSLEPGQRFSYHDLVKNEYRDNVVVTTKAHFSAKEGFKSDGVLFGMGVCHLASVIHWSAKSAALESIAPTNHDFYAINEVSKEFGVAIYASPEAKSVSELQNLYIKNTHDKAVIFRFEFDGDNLKVIISKTI